MPYLHQYTHDNSKNSLIASNRIDTAWSQPTKRERPPVDSDVLQEIEQWMATKLPCVAGRREFSRGRYMIRMAQREIVADIYEDFKRALRSGEVVACLYVFNDHRYSPENSGVSGAFKFLAEMMEPISSLPKCALAAGAPLTNSINLRCPVTGQLSDYDDFECIAFCPQSNDIEDDLYDPLLSMPYPAVNMSSDVYAFSCFVAEGIEKVLGHPAWEEKDMDRLDAVMRRCVDRWQRVAVATIDKYESLTDTSRCPVHVTKDSAYWIAGHKDPAFAEAVKEVHKHELPVLYGNRIADEWMRYFRDGESYNANGLARDGERL